MFAKSLITVGAAICLVACSSPAWRKPNVNEHDTNNALAQCKYEIGLNKAGNPSEMIKHCMESKGFRWGTN